MVLDFGCFRSCLEEGSAFLLLELHLKGKKLVYRGVFVDGWKIGAAWLSTTHMRSSGALD